jgi:hypothetical protein
VVMICAEAGLCNNNATKKESSNGRGKRNGGRYGLRWWVNVVMVVLLFIEKLKNSDDRSL